MATLPIPGAKEEHQVLPDPPLASVPSPGLGMGYNSDEVLHWTFLGP